MALVFEPGEGMIRVPVRLWGPDRSEVALLSLDTGAEGTIVRPDILVRLGYELASVKRRTQLTTASGMISAPSVRIQRIEALDHTKRNFLIAAHPVPFMAQVDGDLGLNFFLRRKLIIDFRIGVVVVE